jgi:hypothetical protein
MLKLVSTYSWPLPLTARLYVPHGKTLASARKEADETDCERAIAAAQDGNIRHAHHEAEARAPSSAACRGSVMQAPFAALSLMTGAAG